MTFFEQSWEGNTVLRWLLAVGVLLAVRLVRGAVDGALGRRAERPEKPAVAGGRWLPAIADAVRKPAGILLWTAGLWAIKRAVLIIPGWLSSWVDQAVYACFMLGLGWLLVRLADSGVDGYLTRSAARKGVPIDGLLSPLLRTGARFLVWSVVLVLALDNAGFKLTAILGGLGLGGLAVAMASKELITDVLGGLTIMLNRPFAVGDKIMFKGQWAIVNSFGLRTTILIDFAANYKYVVPNSHFVHNEVVNISDHPGNMILMNIRLSLTNTADQVALALTHVQEILKGHAEVRYIWSKLDHFDDYAFTLRIHYDILEFRHRIRVKSEINLALARAFQSSGIKFAAMPVRTLTDQVDSSDFVG